MPSLLVCGKVSPAICLSQAFMVPILATLERLQTVIHVRNAEVLVGVYL